MQTYEDLMEQARKLQKKAKEIKEKELIKIGNTIMNDHPDIKSFDDFMKKYEAYKKENQNLKNQEDQIIEDDQIVQDDQIIN